MFVLIFDLARLELATRHFLMSSVHFLSAIIGVLYCSAGRQQPFFICELAYGS